MRDQEGQEKYPADSNGDPLKYGQRPGVLRRRRRRRRTGLPADGSGERVDGGRYRVVGMAGLNPRRHHFVDHTVRDRIGHYGLESVTDFDPHLMILGHDEKGQPVIEPLPAHFPFCEGADGPVLDRRIARRGGDVHNQLVACGLLVGGQACVQRAHRFRRQKIRGVGDPLGGRRRDGRFSRV